MNAALRHRQEYTGILRRRTISSVKFNLDYLQDHLYVTHLLQADNVKHIEFLRFVQNSFR